MMVHVPDEFLNSMLAVVSPAKALDFDPLMRAVSPTVPRLLSESAEIGAVARKRSRADFKSLMDLSDALADLTYERFQAYDIKDPARDAKPAVFAYAGDTYRGFDVTTLDDASLDYAQTHFRILSGLYGLLKPLDLIKAHRLEMGTKLENPAGRDLYAFWDRKIAELLNADCEAAGGAQVIVNCASVEYFKSVKKKALAPQVVTPVFKEEKGGKARVVSFYAKRARGMMARFMVENRIDQPQGLKEFAEDGYCFRPHLSDESTYVFSRLTD